MLCHLHCNKVCFLARSAVMQWYMNLYILSFVPLRVSGSCSAADGCRHLSDSRRQRRILREHFRGAAKNKSRVSVVIESRYHIAYVYMVGRQGWGERVRADVKLN